MTRPQRYAIERLSLVGIARVLREPSVSRRADRRGRSRLLRRSDSTRAPSCAHHHRGPQHVDVLRRIEDGRDQRAAWASRPAWSVEINPLFHCARPDGVAHRAVDRQRARAEPGCRRSCDRCGAQARRWSRARVRRRRQGCGTARRSRGRSRIPRIAGPMSRRPCRRSARRARAGRGRRSSPAADPSVDLSTAAPSSWDQQRFQFAAAVAAVAVVVHRVGVCRIATRHRSRTSSNCGMRRARRNCGAKLLRCAGRHSRLRGHRLGVPSWSVVKPSVSLFRRFLAWIAAMRAAALGSVDRQISQRCDTSLAWSGRRRKHADRIAGPWSRCANVRKRARPISIANFIELSHVAALSSTGRRGGTAMRHPPSSTGSRRD